MIELAKDKWSDLDWISAARLYCRERGLRDPLRAYHQQITGAARREIEWRFTFETWWDFWKDHFHRRGGGAADLCMARCGDTGPYAPWNVYLATNTENFRDYLENSAGRRKRVNKPAKEKRLSSREWLTGYLQFLREFVGPPKYAPPYEEMIQRLRMIGSETRRAAKALPM